MAVEIGDGGAEALEWNVLKEIKRDLPRGRSLRTDVSPSGVPDISGLVKRPPTNLPKFFSMDQGPDVQKLLQSNWLQLDNSEQLSQIGTFHVAFMDVEDFDASVEISEFVLDLSDSNNQVVGLGVGSDSKKKVYPQTDRDDLMSKDEYVRRITEDKEFEYMKFTGEVFNLKQFEYFDFYESRPSGRVWLNEYAQSSTPTRFPDVGPMVIKLPEPSTPRDLRKPTPLHPHTGEGFTLEGSISLDPSEFPLLAKESTLNLAEGTLRLINLVRDRQFDTVFFLDKSARPAAYLFRETWRQLYPDVPVPQVNFVNIGQEQRGIERAYGPHVPSSLRNVYAKIGRLVGVADEYSANGTSVDRAVTLVEEMSEKALVTGTGIYRDLPAWYKVDDLKGVQDGFGFDVKDQYIARPLPRSRRKPAVALRKEMKKFAKIIAGHAKLEQNVPIEPVEPGYKSWDWNASIL